jgi:hypothetical protein
MDRTLHLEGTARRVGIYDLGALEPEAFDPDTYDLEDEADLARLAENIEAMAESGELDLLGNSIVVTGVEPETIDTLSLSRGEEEHPLEIDALRMKNLSACDPLKPLLEAEPGTLFYLRSEEGEGVWDLHAEIEETAGEEVEMGYYDCSRILDNYELLRESWFDYLCDTLVPDETRIAGVRTDTERFVFRPTRIEGALYRVAAEPGSETRFLERLPLPPQSYLDESAEEL